MREYIFLLGREPELAVAEITAIFGRFGLPWQPRLVNDTAIVAAVELNQNVFTSLAGTIKVAEVLGEIEINKAVAVNYLSQQLPADGRCEFGLSWYGTKAPGWLNSLGLELKTRLKAGGGHVRFVTSRSATLSSVVVTKNKLLPPRGYEFLFLPYQNKLLISRTVWVQDYEAWSGRDYGRPERDARVGMLPPKLARLMINLASPPVGAGILDPFCGSGTVLQEAAILGYRHLVGIDADAKGIERTQANFSWLKKSQPQISEPALMVSGVKNVISILHQSTFDAIVTEPYLGPPLRGHESKPRLEQINRELTEFYRMTLKILSRLLKPDGRIVMVWPVLRSGNQNLILPLISEIKSFGLEVVDVLPKQAPTAWRNSRGTLWYARPEARVIREIVTLVKLS